ncbi:hypothetical protein Ddc_19852 [Ditylenchus destructor]|nr:hypothetical protein Ddc_19852 [Ditylenchus destructor]
MESRRASPFERKAAKRKVIEVTEAKPEATDVPIPKHWESRFKEIAKSVDNSKEYAEAIGSALEKFGVNINVGAVGKAVSSIASTYFGLSSIESIVKYLKYGYKVYKIYWKQQDLESDLVTARQTSKRRFAASQSRRRDNLDVIPAGTKITVDREFQKRSREDCYRGRIISVGQGRQNDKGEWLPGEWEAGDSVFLQGEGIRIRHNNLYLWFYNNEDVLGCLNV